MGNPHAWLDLHGDLRTYFSRLLPEGGSCGIVELRQCSFIKFGFSDAEEESVSKVVSSNFSSLQCFCLICRCLTFSLLAKLCHDNYKLIFKCSVTTDAWIARLWLLKLLGWGFYCQAFFDRRRLIYFLSLCWIGILKLTPLPDVFVNQLSWQILLALSAFDIKLLAHTVWVERCTAFGLGTFQSLLVEVHYALTDANGLEFWQELTWHVYFVARIATHEALSKEVVVGAAVGFR